MYNKNIYQLLDYGKFLNKYLKKTDNFHPEDFLKFACLYLNQRENNYVFSKITMYDHNNYGVKNHYFITDEVTAEILNNKNCEYDLDFIKDSDILKDSIHIEEGKFSLIDSNYDLNRELIKKDELIYPIYRILQMKIDNPYILNEERLDNMLLDNKKELTKY